MTRAPVSGYFGQQSLTIYSIYRYLVHAVVQGFTSLAVLILLIGRFIIGNKRSAGLCVGKIFEQMKGRPPHVIERVFGVRADQ